MKKVYTLAAAALFSAAAIAQEALPYEANWQYKAEAIADDGTVTTADPDAGKPTSNQELYNLGGWTSIAETGNRPFYIGASSGKPITNTMEFVDNKQPEEGAITSWLVSPELNFNANSVKTISFKCGKEADNQTTSILELVYTTNYTGDVTTTEWTTLKADIQPVTGMTAAKMGEVNATCNVQAANVVVAIKATKSSIAYIEGAKQAKFRVTAFKVTEEAQEESNAITLPYEAKWSYKAELIIPADSTFVDTFDSSNAGSYKEDPANLDLDGWFNVKEEGDRQFCVVANKNAADKKRQVPNTLEWTDNKQTKTNTTWLVSPTFDFSVAGDKYINFQTGREAIDQQASNIDLLYSTDFAGDVTTATWNTIIANVVPADQTGLAPADVEGSDAAALMAVINEKVAFTDKAVTLAFKAHATGGAAGAKQTKIRIRNFKVLLQNPSSIRNAAAEGISAYVADGRLVVCGEVAKAEVYNVAGQAVNAESLSNGLYLVRLTAIDGSVATSKVLVK